MKILILNWRDIMHPQAGGAEQITEKYACYWISKGHAVFWLTNLYSGAKNEEAINGIHYKRIGPILSQVFLKNIFVYPVYLFLTILKAKNLIQKENIDIVVDEIHGLPFFSPVYSNKRNILLVCEVAGTIWDKMYPFPVNKLGKLFEKLIYFIYRNTEIWAISQNTKKELLALNRNLKVKILPLGIDAQKININYYLNLEKYEYPAACFLARLVKMKGVESAIEAARIITKKLPNFKLYIIGKGEPGYENYLKQIVKKKALENNVVFLSHVPEEKKYEVLRKSHFLVHPSYKEGFGLTVLEADLVGTPSIVRSGSSLNELVENNVNGYIVGSEKEIAEKYIKAIKTKSCLQLGQNAQVKALKYDWEIQLAHSDAITGL